MPIAILAHRGLWQRKKAKNSPAALREALRLGFGIETDIRDQGGQLVISHDPPAAAAPLFRPFLEEWLRHPALRPILALNIKADGLGMLLRREMQQARGEDYFVFDMSPPEMLVFLQQGFPVYTRQSEYEPKPLHYDRCQGVWMDSFDQEWITPKHIAAHVKRGKKVALVSPEIHGRDPLPLWKRLKTLSEPIISSVALCTDRPKAARTFFHA